MLRLPIFFFGESGTELLFRIIMNACLGTDNQGIVLGSIVGILLQGVLVQDGLRFLVKKMF